METTPEKKELSPVYLSVSKLDQVIRLLSTRSPKEVSLSTLQSHEFGRYDAVVAVGALKFLGLIDDEGKPTPLMSKIQYEGDARKAEWEKIVRQAYQSLFEVLKTPQDIPVNELSNDMMSTYGVTKRVAKPAALSFLKLCEYAGLKEEGSVIGRKRTAGVKKVEKKPGISSRPASKEGRGEAGVEEGFASIRVAEGRMVLSVPSELKDRILDDEALEEDWPVLRAALRAFADKHIPHVQKNETPDTESEE